MSREDTSLETSPEVEVEVEVEVEKPAPRKREYPIIPENYARMQESQARIQRELKR